MEARLTLGADAQVIATRHPMRLAEAAVVKISTKARFEFSAKARYAPTARLDMWSCAENNNVVKTDTGGSDFILPGEKGYKDPDHLEQGAKK